MSRRKPELDTAERMAFIDAAFEAAILSNDPLLPPNAAAMLGGGRTKMRNAWWLLAVTRTPELEILSDPKHGTDPSYQVNLELEWEVAVDALVFAKPTVNKWRKFDLVNRKCIAYENLHGVHGNLTPCPTGIEGLRCYAHRFGFDGDDSGGTWFADAYEKYLRDKGMSLTEGIVKDEARWALSDAFDDAVENQIAYLRSKYRNWHDDPEITADIAQSQSCSTKEELHEFRLRVVAKWGQLAGPFKPLGPCPGDHPLIGEPSHGSIVDMCLSFRQGRAA